MCFILKVLLTLSHGQAAVERGFSLGKSNLQININEESIVAKKVIRDHLLANKLDPHSYQVCNKLILSCNTAYSRYKASLEEVATKSKTQQDKEQREMLEKELFEFKQKHLSLKKTCESLDSEFFKFILEAEKKPDLNFIVKANAIKRRCDEEKK